MKLKAKSCIYLDYAASTPVAEEVFDMMKPYFTEHYGNPNSLHIMGQEARRAVDDARAEVKKFLGAQSLREIIFTGSATEANNLAIRGIVASARKAANFQKEIFGHPMSTWTSDVHEVLPHVVTTLIEHKSVLATVGELEKSDAITATYLKPDRNGIVSAEQVVAALRPETILVSIMYANNEIGTIQPLTKISEAIRNFREAKKLTKLEAKSYGAVLPLLHTDAVQAVGFLESDTQKLGVDMLTISGHKIYGPKGIGALYIREEVLPHVAPQITGGGQEYHLRSGTEAVPLIVGLGAAAKLASTWKLGFQVKEMMKLRDYLIDELKTKFGAELNGADGDRRLPNNINIYLPGTDAELLLIGLSEAGICVSTASACLARGQEPSHVLAAIGLDSKIQRGSIRLTLGRGTTREELDDLLVILQKIKR